MFNIRMILFGIVSALRWMGMAVLALVRGAGKRHPVPQNRKWHQRPGLSVMYQIETRPGWKWDRDFIEFNKSMTDEKGAIRFNGPFCNMKECVELSRKMGLDYHVFEVKWCDGICYFKTNTTKWVADHDYAREFADLSRQAGIPFMYYYSAVFDHNPQFDSIQPVQRSLPSLIGNKKEYREYLLKHYDEIIAQYRPDGMWFDWWWADGSTKETWKYFRRKYPDVVTTFNLSNLFPASYNKIHITSGEVHRYDGPWATIRKEDSVKVPVLTSAKKWSNAFRWIFNHQWEVCTPAGKWWQDQTLRDDPLELIRLTAMVLACGGKLCIGATSQMNGHIFPDQVQQLMMLGEWYKPRKEYYVNSAPIRYRWFRPLSVRVNSKNFDAVTSAYGDGVLLHLINRRGSKEELSFTLHGKTWNDVREVSIVPQKEKVSVQREGAVLRIEVSAKDVDPVDTILYFTK